MLESSVDEIRVKCLRLGRSAGISRGITRIFGPRRQ